MDLKILSGGAANGLVNAVRERFRAETGLGITGDFGAVGLMRDRILEGEAVDLALLSRVMIDQLADSGHVVPATVRDVGLVETGVSVRSGQPLPDVSTGDLLKQVFLAADAIFVPHMTKSTAGAHVAGVLKTLGIDAEVAGRIQEFPNGQTAMARMAASDHANPVGCTQITEILNTDGVDYAGALPDRYGLVTTYTAAIARDAAEPEAAQALIDILTAPELEETRGRCGFSAGG